MTKPLDTTTETTQPADTSRVQPPSQKSKPEAVIVNFDYRTKDWLPFFKFEDELARSVEDAGIGEFDGNALSDTGQDCSMYIYGPDANAILALIAPRLRSTPLLAQVVVTLRYAR